MKVEQKLSEMGLDLPDPPTPVGYYHPAIVDQGLLWISGQTARINGARRYLGKVGKELRVEDAYLSSRDAALNCLAIVKATTGSLDHIQKIVKMTGYINSAPGFVEQPACLDGASQLLLHLLGEKGKHARVAVGVSDLPFNASVEIELLIRINEHAQ